MAYDLNLLQALVANPSETLSVEIKGWLDLKLSKHVAKVAKALLALRNYGGGHLIFGIDGDSLAPDQRNQKPAHVREYYHTDKIQAIVGRYAAESFPIEVHFVESGGEIFPVVCVPPGIKTVVAAKDNLNDDAGEPLIKKHQVYTRTLGANNTASTSAAQCGDWAAIMETCMDTSSVGHCLKAER
jgi:Putative DNA-binding domain